MGICHSCLDRGDSSERNPAHQATNNNNNNNTTNTSSWFRRNRARRRENESAVAEQESTRIDNLEESHADVERESRRRTNLNTVSNESRNNATSSSSRRFQNFGSLSNTSSNNTASQPPSTATNLSNNNNTNENRASGLDLPSLVASDSSSTNTSQQANRRVMLLIVRAPHSPPRLILFVIPNPNESGAQANNSSPFLPSNLFSSLQEESSEEENQFHQLMNHLFEAAARSAQQSHRPTSNKALRALPQITITSEILNKHHKCSICLEEFKVDQIVVSLPCSHLFEKDCLEPWLKDHNTCPVCRYELPLEDEAMEKERKERMQKLRPEVKEDYIFKGDSNQEENNEKIEKTEKSEGYFEIDEMRR